MSRKHKGNFSTKHGPDLSIPQEVMDGVAARIKEGSITCVSAFDLAAEYSVSPSIVGAAIDLQEGRLTQCQLGLFGDASDETALASAHKVDADVEIAIHAELDNGRLSCTCAWQIASDLQRPRLVVSRACERLGIRIHQCQLGAF